MAGLQTTSFPYAFFEGEFVKIEEAKVSIMTNALQYGTGFFGGMRAYYNKEKKHLSVFRMEDHIKRFISSARIIGVSMSYDEKQMKEIFMKLIKMNNPKTDTYFRPFGYAGSTNLSPNLERDNNFEFALYMIPLGDYLPTDKGISVCVSSWRRVSDNAIPSRAKISGSYINSALAKLEASQRGFDEAIFLSEDGHVAEGSAMNLFVVRNGTLITPSFSENILEGITRRTVVKLAQDMGIPTVERVVDRTELYISDEAFFSGTGAQVAWISKIDDRTIGTGMRGPVTAKLQDMFFEVVKGNQKKYADWCTIIK